MNTIDLQSFCVGTDDSRVALAKPFSDGEYTFATNGAIIIRVPRIDGVGEVEKAPKNLTKSIFDANPSAEEYVDLSSVEIPTLAGPDKCDHCLGTARHFCDGCDNYHDCGKCDAGQTPEQAISIPICGTLASHLLLNKIKALPGVKLSGSSAGPQFAFDVHLRRWGRTVNADEAKERLTPMNLARPLCFFDIESTGTDVATDRIISLAVVKHFPDSEFSDPQEVYILCNPWMPIPAEASEVHGITDEMVKDKPPFRHFAPELIALLAGCDIAGFNCINFDVPLLYEEFARAGIEWDLTGVAIVDAGNIFKLKEPRTLEAACKFYDAPTLTEAHNAMADTLATANVLAGQLSRYEDLRAMPIAELAKFSQFDQRIDLAGKIVRNKAMQPVYNFGKAKGVPVVDDPGFGNWILRNQFTANTKSVVEKILKGEIV